MDVLKHIRCLSGSSHFILLCFFIIRIVKNRQLQNILIRIQQVNRNRKLSMPYSVGRWAVGDPLSWVDLPLKTTIVDLVAKNVKLSFYRETFAEFLQMKKNKTLTSPWFSSAPDKDSLYESHPDCRCQPGHVHFRKLTLWTSGSLRFFC